MLDRGKMEFINKYFSKKVFNNTAWCLLAYLILRIASGFVLKAYGYSNTQLILGIVISIATTVLLVLMAVFFFRDFSRVHHPVKLKELICLALIIFAAVCVSTFITFFIECDFKFSSYFKDIYLQSLLALFIVFLIVFTVTVNIMAMWKIYEKAGEKGWASIVPFYNIIVMLKIVNRPSWWIVWFLIPFVNIVFAILVTYELSKKFGKYDSFAIGLILLPFIFYPILGFGNDKYDFD